VTPDGRARFAPAWLWLTAIVVGSVAVRIALVGRMPAPWIMVDELIYSELAKSVAAGGGFLVRGVPSSGYGFVYPVLIAPAFRAYASVPQAYAAAKVINAVVMSLTAIPVYFLARRLLSQGLSLVAAAISVAIPSMLYTGTLMTENAFYPVFALAALVLVLTLERPTWLRQVVLLAVCGLAFATRAQAIALFGAALVAPVIHGLIERDLSTRLRRFAPLYGLTAIGAIVAVAGTLARGKSPLSLLGAYRAATDRGFSVSSAAHYLLWHAAELDLALGVVGVAALIAMWLSPRSTIPGARAFSAATLSITVLLVVEVAAFASMQSFRIEERNAFYVAPFAVIALVGLASRDDVVTRNKRVLAVAVLIAGVLPVAVPFARFVNPSAVSDTFGLLPWWWIQDRGIHFGPLRYVALGVGVAAALLIFLPRRFALVAVVLVGVYFVLASAVVENGRHGLRRASAGGLFAGIQRPHPDWIDRRVGRDADVSFLWHYAGETRPLWMNEFFNRSVGTVYTVDGPDPADGGLPETPVHEQSDGRLVTSTGAVPHVRYAVSFTDIAGKPLAHDRGIGLTLYRVNGPLVILTRVRGLFPDDTWGGRKVTYRRVQCSGGQVSVRLGTDAQLFSKPQVVTATVHGREVGSISIPPDEQATLGVPLVPDPSHRCEVTFTAKTVRVPAKVQPGSKDTRALGVHYYTFDYSGPR
jgi:dolichyl-phosphate-mannose-protein mannosyltransferase